MSKWPLVRLGDVATYVNGYAFKPADWAINGLPIIRIQNLNNDEAAFNYYDGVIDSRYIVNNGDILISWSASLGVFVWNKGEAILNQHIFNVVFNKLKIDKSYFKYAIRKILDNMLLQTHGSTMKHIIKARFDNMKLTFPPDDVQKHIANTLDKIQEIIDGHKKQLEELDYLIKATFYEMFGDPVTNEKDWSLLQLSKLGQLGRGVSKHRPRNAPELLGGGYPLIQTGDVANSDLYINEYTQTYSELGLRQSKMWPKGTLCITIAANIARTAILGFDACFPDSVVGFYANGKTNNIFVHFWFSFFQAILEAQAPESAQKNINLRILNDLKVINPPLDLQNKFAEIVTKIEEDKALVKQAITESEHLFNSLMSEYFD